MTMDDIVQGADILADPISQREREMAPIRKVGIIGAGQMGSGIAHVVALSGYDVALNDVAKERFDAALSTINNNM
jgi:3-hydroxybutyryl-CoA dehydrogenase